MQQRSNYTYSRTLASLLLVHKSATAAPCRQVLEKACGSVNITDVSVVINTRDVSQIQFRGVVTCVLIKRSVFGIQ